MDINACVIQNLDLDHDHKMKLWRWDLIHHQVSGNKWFKLWGHYQKMLHKGITTMITFGGAFSNHLHAVAHFCHLHQLKAVCIVRGDEHNSLVNPTLADITNLGATLHFLCREEYALKEQSDTFKLLMEQYPNAHIVPEGGSGEDGLLGFEILKKEFPDNITDVCVSVGTGTTLRGLRRQLPLKTRLVGISSFKNLNQQLPIDYLENNNIRLIHYAELGRFGQVKQELIDYLNDFYKKYHIPLDVVYTGKMMMAIERLYQEGFFDLNSEIMAVHTGGLQGNISWQDRLIF